MDTKERQDLQQELIELFTKYDLSVGVGLTRTGIAIRSQDERVDAANIGILEPYAKAR